MIKIGKKEIQEAINNINFDKEMYYACDIDEMIWKYYKLSTYDEYTEATQNSHEFCYHCETYEVIDEIMIKKGFKSNDDMTEYRKVSDL